MRRTATATATAATATATAALVRAGIREVPPSGGEGGRHDQGAELKKD